MGAFLNVRINASSLEDKAFVASVLEEGAKLQESAQARETEILRIVEQKL